MIEEIHGMNSVTLANPEGATKQPVLAPKDVTPIKVHLPSAPWSAIGPPLSPYEIHTIKLVLKGYAYLLSHLTCGLVFLLGAYGRCNDNILPVVLGAHDVRYHSHLHIVQVITSGSCLTFHLMFLISKLGFFTVTCFSKSTNCNKSTLISGCSSRRRRQQNGRNKSFLRKKIYSAIINMMIFNSQKFSLPLGVTL